MEYQYDPVDLALITDPVRKHLATPVAPELLEFSQSLWARGWQRLHRWRVGPSRWREIQQKKQLQQTLNLVRKGIADSVKPVLVYVVPYDIGKLQSGGGKRIAGIAKALSAEFNVYIVSSVWSSTSFSVVQVAPNCHLLSLPACYEFLEQCRILNAVPGAGVFAFPDFFGLLPEYHAVLSLLGGHARAWGFTSPSAWPVLQKYLQQGDPVFYDAHDDYSQFLQNSFSCTEERLVNRLVDLERELLSQVTLAVFCTMNDLASAQARYPMCAGEMMQIPNGVDVETCLVVPPAQAKEYRKAIGLDRPVAVFVGAHHKPNLEAVDFIVRELAPAFPEVVFVVMGMHLEPYRTFGGAEPGSNLVFTGPVSEEIKEAVFSLSEVALAPMGSGTGSSLKIPDYVAHGKVVVGTPFGLRGFETLARFPSVIATEDVPGSFAQVMDRLAQDPASFDDSCHEAWAVVKATLDWSVVAHPLVAILKTPEAMGPTQSLPTK